MRFLKNYGKLTSIILHINLNTPNYGKLTVILQIMLAQQ